MSLARQRQSIFLINLDQSRRRLRSSTWIARVLVVLCSCDMIFLATAFAPRARHAVHPFPRCDLCFPLHHLGQGRSPRSHVLKTLTAAHTTTTTRLQSTKSSSSPDRGFSIAVVGGGASGIFSAIAAAEQSLWDQQYQQANKINVAVLEATDQTLRKVAISGGGRCNVLHDTDKPVRELLQGYPRGSKELNGILHKSFPPEMARSWFESRGVVLKTEDDGRMFPNTDSSQTIINVLLDAAQEAQVEICHRCKVQEISAVAGGVDNSGAPRFRIRVQSRHIDSASRKDESWDFDAVILATGSTPLGYRLAHGLGHEIVPTVPSLFTLNAKQELSEPDGLLCGLAGVSVPHAKVAFRLAPTSAPPTATSPSPQKSASKSKRSKAQWIHQEGPLLVTHQGLSGPAILRLSAFGARELHDVRYRGTLRIHWAPDLGTTETVSELLWSMTQRRPRKQVALQCPLTIQTRHKTTGEAVTIQAVPRRLWAALTQRAGINKKSGNRERDDNEEPMVWAHMSKKAVRQLARQICECEVEITGKGTFKDEFVTAGGVSLKEINMKTMQSKKCPGLYFCGELINVDGVTGGYNFMNCWSTGYVAGTSAAQHLVQSKDEVTQGSISSG